jgi:hypothetical protein
MTSPSSRYQALVLRPSLLKLGALAVLMGAAPALRAQAPAPGLGCGDRPPGEYAVVLDASSSLGNPRLARQTEDHYVDVLERIAGMLCRDERLLVYPMVRDDSLRLVAVDSVLPADVSRARLRGVAQKALGRDPRHSDFLLVVNRTRDDILSRPGMRAVFFLTDGSFYPHPVPVENRRLQTVLDRLVELEQVVERLRQDGAPFYVVGIRAGEAKAVDPQLRFTWPDSTGRVWRHRGRPRDLRQVSGDTLLGALFGTAFVPGERLDLWNLLIGDPASPWQRRLGYSGGWTRQLPDLRSVRMEHLMFVPPDSTDPASCARVRHGPRTAGAPQPVQPVRVGADHYACSLERPTAAELDSIAARVVHLYAFRQTPRFQPVEDPAPLYGLHEFILSLDGTPCPGWTQSRDFLLGRELPGGSPVSLLEIVPISEARANDTVSMVRKDGSPCIVPNVAVDTTNERHGDYLLFLSDADGEWVHRRRFEIPKLKLASLDFRPGGFPFPPDRLALLRVCINSVDPIHSGERLLVELGGKTHVLEDARRADCPTPAPGAQRPYAYGFGGVILLESTELASARVVIVPAGQSSSITGRARWLPIPLKPSGAWFLSRVWLFVSILLGLLLQVGYLWIFTDVRPRHLRNLRRALSIGLSIAISCILTVVFAECVVMITQSPLESSAIPVPFALVLLAHGMKLFAAALLPELVENAALD